MNFTKRIILLIILGTIGGWSIAAASKSRIDSRKLKAESELRRIQDSIRQERLEGREFKLPETTLPYSDSFPEFLDLSVNQILNQEALHPFFEQLRQLEAQELGKVTVAHIGDSHIQADMFTGRIRALLQQRFGAVGRGFIFPYRMADTNSPIDLKAGSDGTWDFRRNIYDKNGLPIGLAGMSIQTRKKDFTLAIQIKPDTLFDQSFDKVDFFYQGGPDYLDYKLGYFEKGKAVATPVTYTRKYHKVKSGETLSGIAGRYRCSVRSLQRWNGLRGTLIRVGQRLVVGNGAAKAAYAGRPFKELARVEQPAESLETGYFSFTSDQLVDELVIKGEARLPSQRKGLLYGLSVENSSRAGLLYHSIGVNGASFYHYNRSEYFLQQLPSLLPHLLIVSLGTNEALSSGFKADKFREQVDAFLASIREKMPEIAILVTTNPDALKRGRYGKTTNPIAREVLIETAEKYGAAIWDLQTIMNVSGGVQKWRAEGLSGRDLIHFTRRGYELQGHLLYEALMNTYELY